jgi:glycosyltransferase involved in cell wall biosynthesis
VVRLDVDVVHAPSLAVSAGAAHRSRDRARHRVHPAAARPLAAVFHRRGFELARAKLRSFAPSAFTRSELIREGFDPDGVVLAPLGVNRPVPRDPDEIDATVARAGVRAPFLLTVGTVEPRKDLPTIVAALQRLRTRRPDLELVVVGPKGWGDVVGLDRPGVQVLGPQPWRVASTGGLLLHRRYEASDSIEALARRPARRHRRSRSRRSSAM